MISLAFGFIALSWGLLSALSLWKFCRGRLNPMTGARFRRPESLLIAFAFAVPPYWVARELAWVARAPTTVVLAATATAGMFGLLVAYHYRSQR